MQVYAAAHLVAIFGTHFDQVGAVAVGMCFGLNLSILRRAVLEEFTTTTTAAAAAAGGILQRHLLQRVGVEEQTPSMTVVLAVEQHTHLAGIEGELAARREREIERER